jgi:hypothetical protein
LRGRAPPRGFLEPLHRRFLERQKGEDTANVLSRDDYPDKAPILTELEKTNSQIAKGMSRNFDAKAWNLSPWLSNI